MWPAASYLALLPPLRQRGPRMAGEAARGPKISARQRRPSTTKAPSQGSAASSGSSGPPRGARRRIPSAGPEDARGSAATEGLSSRGAEPAHPAAHPDAPEVSGVMDMLGRLLPRRCPRCFHFWACSCASAGPTRASCDGADSREETNDTAALIPAEEGQRDEESRRPLMPHRNSPDTVESFAVQDGDGGGGSGDEGYLSYDELYPTARRHNSGATSETVRTSLEAFHRSSPSFSQQHRLTGTSGVTLTSGEMTRMSDPFFSSSANSATAPRRRLHSLTHRKARTNSSSYTGNTGGHALDGSGYFGQNGSGNTGSGNTGSGNTCSGTTGNTGSRALDGTRLPLAGSTFVQSQDKLSLANNASEPSESKAAPPSEGDAEVMETDDAYRASRESLAKLLGPATASVGRTGSTMHTLEGKHFFDSHFKRKDGSVSSPRSTPSSPKRGRRNSTGRRNSLGRASLLSNSVETNTQRSSMPSSFNTSLRPVVGSLGRSPNELHDVLSRAGTTDHANSEVSRPPAAPPSGRISLDFLAEAPRRHRVREDSQSEDPRFLTSPAPSSGEESHALPGATATRSDVRARDSQRPRQRKSSILHASRDRQGEPLEMDYTDDVSSITPDSVLGNLEDVASIDGDAAGSAPPQALDAAGAADLEET